MNWDWDPEEATRQEDGEVKVFQLDPQIEQHVCEELHMQAQIAAVLPPTQKDE